MIYEEILTPFVNEEDEEGGAAEGGEAKEGGEGEATEDGEAKE